MGKWNRSELVDNPKEFVEIVRELHYLVVSSTNPDISHEEFQEDRTRKSGKIYNCSRDLFLAAIRTAYPDVDAERVYHVWADCNESIDYCVGVVRTEP
jgi:hypothetical protein